MARAFAALVLAVRSGLRAAADKATTPTLLMVARNDRTTESASDLAERLKARGVPQRLAIYEAGGHALFGARGMHVWERDVLEFFGRHLRPAGGAAPQ